MFGFGRKKGNGKRADVHLSDAEKAEPPRFEYSPRHIWQRLFVSIGGKTRLSSSRLIRIEYHARWRWILSFLLVLVTIFLTPQLLPRWLGFKWSTTSDLCEGRDVKLERLQIRMEAISNVTAGARFVQKTFDAVECMNISSQKTWGGAPMRRVQYPGECTFENAKNAHTTKRTVCVGGQRVEKCVKLFGFIKLKCVGHKTPRKCETISATDPKAVKRIAELNAARRLQQQGLEADMNSTKEKGAEIKQTANKAGERLINRLVIQVDIASNLYIVYTIFAVLVGTPLVIFKRAKRSYFAGCVFGMNKANFVVMVVIGLTLYDSGRKVIVDTDFMRLFRNFQNDPCYLDPKFSKSRLEFIRDTCGNVTKHRARINERLAQMNTIFFDVQLCEVSVVAGRVKHANKTLVSTINEERKLYSAGNRSGYIYPGTCNATLLNEATSTPPDRKVNWFQAFFGSGILAQLLLKGIVTSFLTHFIAYYEPMTMHRGIVEIFGMDGRDSRTSDEEEGGGDEDDEMEILTEEEEESCRRFARDKHLFPLIFCCILMIAEILIIGYSIYISKFGKRNSLLEQVIEPPPPVPASNYRCQAGKLIRISRQL